MLVWLVSYPRSGNTFARVVLNHYFSIESYSLSGDVNDIGLLTNLGNFVGHRSGDERTIDFDKARRSADVVVVKTHGLPNPSISKDDTVIYIHRDGRDAVVSLYYYNRDFLNNRFITWSEIICGQIKVGTWGNHALRWHQSNYPKMLLAKYEEITRDPGTYAARLGGILNRNPTVRPFPPFESFRQTDAKFFRSGVSGGWRAAFGARELALFNLVNEPAMRLLGYAEGEFSDADLSAYSRFQSLLDEDYILTRCEVAVSEAHQNWRKSQKQTLAEKNRILTERNNRIVELNNLVKARTQRISELQSVISKKNKKIERVRRKFRRK